MSHQLSSWMSVRLTLHSRASHQRPLPTSSCPNPDSHHDPPPPTSRATQQRLLSALPSKNTQNHSHHLHPGLNHYPLTRKLLHHFKSVSPLPLLSLLHQQPD